MAIMAEEHKIPLSISMPCCGYCDSFHNDYKLLANRERICAKGEKVWMLSCMCGAYHQQTRYNCPHEGGKEVSSIQCINNRMIGFPHCMSCINFLGEKAEPRIKPKKIIKREPLKQIKKKPAKKGVSIHDILKKKGGE
jgi:hypothetical protein